ncbi:MAG: adenylate cyclase regulatory domain-containing protein, partial [Acidimicrobiia bacterium]
MTDAELAQRSGVTTKRIRRLVELGILSRSGSDPPYAEPDVRRVRLAEACRAAGLPLEAIGSAIQAGRLSLAFLDLPVYGGWTAHAGGTFGQLARETGVPVELLGAMREALGFARPSLGDPVREDDLRVVPTIRVALEVGLNPAVMIRMLRVYGEALARIAEAEGAVYRRYLEDPLRRSGERAGEVVRLASDLGGRFVPLLEEALLAIYRRQQERVWLQNLIEDIERALEEGGVLERIERSPAMCFLDLTGYTRLTEERGDEAAAGLVARVGDLVQGSSV